MKRTKNQWITFFFTAKRFKKFTEMCPIGIIYLDIVLNMINTQEIAATKMFSEMFRSGAVFSVKFRKKSDGKVSLKSNIVRLSKTGENLLNARKNLTNEGRLKCFDPANGHEFEFYVDLLIRFNGYKINWYA